MGLALCRGIRERYPEWRYLLDGDGGDENLKDYPIEENPELTIRSVVNNPMLYQEGWGVGRMKHSLTYSGGLSRCVLPHVRAPQAVRVRGLQPVHAAPTSSRSPRRSRSIALATGVDERLYALKGEIVARGVKAVTGIDDAGLPEAPLPARRDRPRGGSPERLLSSEASCYRSHVLSLYALTEVRRARPSPEPARSSAIAGSFVAATAPAIPVDPFARLRRSRRGRAVGVRRGRPGRDDLPDEPRVPVALPDVRPVEEHADRGDAPPRRDPGADRTTRSPRLPPARRDQALQRRQLLRPARRPAGATSPRSPSACRAVRARHRGVPSRARRRSAASGFATGSAGASRSRWGSRRRTRGPGAAQQEDDARLRPRPPAFLRKRRHRLRAFVLVGPPFLDDGRGARVGRPLARLRLRLRRRGGLAHPDARRATARSTRSPRQGRFAPPRLAIARGRRSDVGLALGRGRVFADPWDLERFSRCATASPPRRGAAGAR